MYCPQCRSELPDDAKYCIKCGYDFTKIKTPPEKKSYQDLLDGLGTSINQDSDIDCFKVGSLFANRYEILSEGHKGGMGAVYKVKDTKLNKIKALKVIHPRLLNSPHALSRFRQEVAISQELQHKNIVRVYDIEEWEKKEYFTMEWVDGTTLREIISKRKSENRPFSLDEAYKIVSQLSDALNHAHKYTIHRDIKPENILVTDEKDFRVKLTDFGIAKMLSPSQFTSTSMQMGTPYYMAPEQKEDAGQIDKRADIYSLGVILFELLTLHNTIGPEMPSELNSSLPKKTDALFRKAVASRPDNRYASAKDLSEALKEVVAEEARKAEQKKAEEEKRKKQEAERQRQEEEAKKEEERRKNEEVKRQEEKKKKEEAERKQSEEEKKKREEEEQRKKQEDRKMAEEAEKKKKEAEAIKAEKEKKEEEARRKQQEEVKVRQKGLLFATIAFIIILAAVYVYKKWVPAIDMVYVKGGCYQMGDTFGDGEADEKPAHEVCVDDFYIGKYEVTQGQYKEVMGGNPAAFKDCGDNCPVENVSLEDIRLYINKLNITTGNNYRLPTEAEWEYAARSGGKKEKWAGTSSESELKDYAWYRGNSGDKTHPVGKKKPNGFGIYDMSGNVWEWCDDIYDENYYKNSPKDNPKGSGGNDLVLRGGGWYDVALDLRVANRTGGNEYLKIDSRGFRLARSVK